MKRLRLILLGLTILAASCQKESIHSDENGLQGEFKFAISGTSSDIAILSGEATGPETADFKVQIYKKPDDVRLYKDSYANTIGKSIRLNTGDYTVTAHHGDSLGCGFNKPYYLAKEPFSITRDNRQVSIEAVAKLGNFKFDVTMDELPSDLYSDQYVIIKHSELQKKEVKFIFGETREAYMPAGKVYVEYYILETASGKWKYTRTEPLEYAPATFAHFKIRIKGEGGFTVTVDDSTSEIEMPFEIPWYIAEQDAPVITPQGELAKENIALMRGIDYEASYSVYAKNRIKECWLTIESEYINNTYDIPAVETKIAPLYSSSTKTKYRNAGLYWDEDMYSSSTTAEPSPAFINFDGMFRILNEAYKSDTEDGKVIAQIRIRIKDKADKEATHSFTVTHKALTSSLEINGADVWAKRVAEMKLTTNGVVELFTTQVNDGSGWKTLRNTFTSVSGEEYVAYDLKGLTPGTSYKVRLIYDNDESCASNEVEITTEEALQLGNSGFEEFHSETFKFSSWFGSSGTRVWYLPWNNGDDANSWWAVNSRVTMPSSTTPLIWNYKVFPTCSWSADAYEGGKSAQISSIAVNDGNINSTSLSAPKAGEMWIGTANNSGGHASEGHAFSSRPTRLDFMYKYKPYGSKKGQVEIYLYDANGNTIAQKAIHDIAEAGSWTAYSVDFEYADTKVKAAKIYVIFRSADESGSGNNDVNKDTSIEMAGTTMNAHIGSVLKIDDLQLIYE